MPRIQIPVCITEAHDIYLDGISVEGLILELQEAQRKAYEEQGAIQVYIDNYMEEASSCGKFRVMAVRLETLEEMIFREDKVKGQGELAKARRKKVYEDLKQEFE
jgi:hypothetical protein